MTTVEALAHEALPTLESNLAIRSAGQNELGTHTVYTHVATTSTCSDQCEEGGKKRRGSKAGDAVQSVIDNAKKLITNVLGGHNDGSHHKNNSHNSDDELRSQVANLQEENSTIKREVSELRKMVENLQLTIKNLQLLRDYSTCGSVLVLADGNLTFSASFASQFPSTSLTATVIESYDQFVTRYGNPEVVEAIWAQPRARVEFRTDATQLPAEWTGKFSRILMNFPHHGGKTNHRACRRLLSDMFCSIASIMDKSTQLHLALAKGQSGIPFQIDQDRSVVRQTPPDHEKDSWTAIYLAAAHGLVLHRIEEFDPRLFNGYVSAGFHATHGSFNNYENAQRMIFVKRAVAGSLGELRSIENGSPAEFWTIRTFFVHDLCVRFGGDIPLLEPQVLQIMRRLAGSSLIRLEEVEELRGFCPEPYMPSQIYRMHWQPKITPMDRILSSKMQNEFRDEFAKELARLNLPVYGSGSASAAKPAPAPAKEESKEDEDFDLFGSDDDEDAEKKKVVEERLKAYAEKKAKKPGPIAKSSVILDVKPWDDETNMKEMEDLVRSIEMDGLVWGGGKLIAIGYGISKLQIICVIEDEKVSVDDLIERITTDFESHVQSVDIAAFNKI